MSVILVAAGVCFLLFLLAIWLSIREGRKAKFAVEWYCDTISAAEMERWFREVHGATRGDRL